MGSSEISPRRKAKLPRFEKNRPFHARPITATVQKEGPLAGPVHASR